MVKKKEKVTAEQVFKKFIEVVNLLTEYSYDGGYYEPEVLLYLNKAIGWFTGDFENADLIEKDLQAILKGEVPEDSFTKGGSSQPSSPPRKTVADSAPKIPVNTTNKKLN